jgi:hypothetical protein
LLNINQYLPLYGMLQNRYGGDGINTFAVPKLVPIDADDSTNNVNWSIGGDRLKAIGLLGSLNNYNVQFIRNNVNQFSLTSTGIVSNVDYTTSGNVTLQKGNPRIRLRDTGASGHTNGFDLHVNGDEFIIDDNTHSKNILRNYLNSSVHTTDFDAEVFNFKNGATNYARLSSTGLFLNNLNKNYIPKHTANGLANSQVFDDGTNVGIGTVNPRAKAHISGGGIAIDGYSVPASGQSLEIGYLSTYGQINSYNRTSAAFTQLRIDGLTTVINGGSGGNVGIGTTTPTLAKLQIQDATRASVLASGFATHAVSQSTANGEINIGASSTFQGRIGYDGQNNANLRFTNTYSVSDNSTGGFDFFNGTNRLMRISSSGVLLRGLTTAQINAIASPANGLMVYNTTLNKLCVYENTAWRQVSTTAM